MGKVEDAVRGVAPKLGDLALDGAKKLTDAVIDRQKSSRRPEAPVGTAGNPAK